MRHQLTTWYFDNRSDPRAIQMVQIRGTWLKIGAKPRGLPGGCSCLELIDALSGDHDERSGGGGGMGVWCYSRKQLSIFQVGRHCQKTLLVWKDFISNIDLGQTNSLNLNKFSIGNNVPDCLSAPFTY